MADTAAERLAAVLDLPGIWESHVKGAQRAIKDGWVHRDDLIAQGWTPPPDPWEAIARDVWLFLFPGGEWLAPEFESQRSLVRYMRETITKAEARTIAARIEEGS